MFTLQHLQTPTHFAFVDDRVEQTTDELERECKTPRPNQARHWFNDNARYAMGRQQIHVDRKVCQQDG